MTGRKSAGDWVDPLLRPLTAATVPSTGLDVTVEAGPAERQALARALGLVAVSSCLGRYRLAARAGGIITVTGEVAAEVTATCVVTLAPFALSLREPVEMRFAEPQQAPRARAPVPGTLTAADLLDADDPPDPIEHGVIDLGKVTTEFLALALPVYPRAPGAAFEAAAEEADSGPFAALGALRGGQKDGGN